MQKGAAAGCVLETDLTQHVSKNAEVGERPNEHVAAVSHVD